ncbi:hypothetical protein EPA93_44815 [Ktedonosporobacter rubrisoli]|uniref:Putative zinc-finger domain-containing protein n=1 Tax=Ktedonosporobacter rubrisoli TaxID=2509675 RepID=A0A4P6K3T5_KTERU|nr:zf-HC2 domain-containing protein [Ktedonosporobacter rubrisoli]QBD82715.1 hypothetical protein EPA93_44815 [Ktedonosporobacter rubrisoli]
MTTPIPEDSTHVVDVLPDYLNGQLDAASTRLVREHLVSCETCQLELASWQAIKGAANRMFALTPSPSAHLMQQVWEKIDAPRETQMSQHWRAVSRLRRFWLVFRSQIPLLHKSIWVASALVCLLGLILTLLMNPQTLAQKQSAGDLLVLFIVIAGASGSAFISGSAVDPGFELTIATPTSLRLVMLCRMVLVLGYSFLLGLLASAVFASVYGGGLWGFVQLWVGPLLFLSSLCLTISLFVSSIFALICTAVIEALQTIPARLTHLLSLPLPELVLNPTSPALFIGAFLLIVFAVVFVPGQPRPGTL